MSRFKIIARIAAIALMATAAGAQADTVQLAKVSNGPVLATHVSVNGNDLNVYVGSYNLALQGQGGSFAAYCVDPFQSTYSNNSTVDPDYTSYQRSPLTATNLPAVGATRLADVQRLFGNAYPGSLTSGNTAAGFQLALWEVWHDDKNLTTGSIKTLSSSNAGMVAVASTLLAALANPVTWPTNGRSYDLTFYSSATYQDYIAVVPEPETHALLLGGLALLGLVARRRKAVL